MLSSIDSHLATTTLVTPAPCLAVTRYDKTRASFAAGIYLMAGVVAAR